MISGCLPPRQESYRPSYYDLVSDAQQEVAKAERAYLKKVSDYALSQEIQGGGLWDSPVEALNAASFEMHMYVRARQRYREVTAVDKHERDFAASNAPFDGILLRQRGESVATEILRKRGRS